MNKSLNSTRVRECVAFPGNREQEILSPNTILDPIRQLWGGIQCDPCGSRLHTIAKTTYYPEDNGLVRRWPDMTYANPPLWRP